MRILIECHHGIGDVVMTLPAIQHLQESLPQAQIDMVVGSPSQVELIRSSVPFIHKCISYETRRNSRIELIKTAFRILSKRYDVAIAGSSKHASLVLFLKMCGCERVVAPAEDDPVINNYESIIMDSTEHVADRWLKCARHITGNYSLPVQDVNMAVSMNDVQSLKTDYNLSGHYIGICVGTGDFFYRENGTIHYYNVKSWPIERYSELIDLLLKDGNRILLIGGTKEGETIKEKGLHKLPGVVDLTGISLYKSLCALSLCELVVGGDTGTLHMAAALGKRTVSIFGPTDDRVYRPYGPLNHVISTDIKCRPCYVSADSLIDCEHKSCINSIQTMSVYNVIKHILS